MKKLFLAAAIVMALASCRKAKDDIFFVIGNNREYRFSDIELYDSSTHIIYFKNEHPEFEDIETGSFSFMNEGSLLYSGVFMPGYSSSYPTVPFIMSPPSLYGDYALRIDYMNLNQPDVRNNSSLIGVLESHGLLHSGISVSSCSANISGNNMVFRFTITNHDESDLMVLDINKTGPALFHYFTNGLYIYDQDNLEVFKSGIQHQEPQPWNSWKPEWLTRLGSGESLDFNILYCIGNPLDIGVYNMSFEFPGLAYQVKRDELYQSGGRIWLGDVSVKQQLIVK